MRPSRVWAAFVREQPDAPWRLCALASLSGERARALVERELARRGQTGAGLLVREFASARDVPRTLDA